MPYDSETGDMTITLVGDLMLTRSLSIFKEGRFLQLRELFKNADATFANFESTARIYDEGSPNLRKGTFMTTEPKLLEDIKWLGINIVSCANNHAFDYGESGILANIRHLDASGIHHAGTGRNLAEARAPAYLDTPGGRVALIAATSTFNQWEQAGEQRTDFRGKPGVNPLGFKNSYVVDNKAMDELRRISTLLGLEAQKERQRNFGFLSSSEVGFDSKRDLNFLGQRFLRGRSFAIQTTANERDIAENLRQLSEARRQADWVIVSLHCHEMGGTTFLTAKTQAGMEEWADFARAFSRQCIDSGADIVVGHGPHIALGVEVYKNKPIFHSLGNFVFQNETIRLLPAFPYTRFGLDHNATPADFIDARSECGSKAHPADPLFWQGICAVCKFIAGNLEQIILYPLDLGYGRPRSQRGRPLIDDSEVGKRIIKRIARLSKEFGSEIVYKDGCGIIRLDKNKDALKTV